MAQGAFQPILYLKETCPFCLKLRLFLLEAGLLDRFEQRSFIAGDANEAAIRAELQPHFDKVTFPTVQYAPDKYLQDSDAIIAHYAQEEGLDPTTLSVFSAYATHVLPQYLATRRELAALKKSD